MTTISEQHDQTQQETPSEAGRREAVAVVQPFKDVIDTLRDQRNRAMEQADVLEAEVERLRSVLAEGVRLLEAGQADSARNYLQGALAADQEQPMKSRFTQTLQRAQRMDYPPHVEAKALDRLAADLGVPAEIDAWNRSLDETAILPAEDEEKRRAEYDQRNGAEEFDGLR